MTEKNFEQQEAGDMVYKGNSPLGEDFTRGEQYIVAENSECHSIIGISDAIDWEQRRYEIAKAAMVGLLAAPIVEGMDPNPSMAAVCKWSVMFADTLIEELKKSNSQA